MRLDLRRFRKEHGIYQSELATVLNLAQSGISRIENEFLELTQVQYNKMCDEYGKDKLEKYIIDSNETISSLPKSILKDEQASTLLDIIQKQQDTIRKSMESEQEFIEKYSRLNERLIIILENMTGKIC